MPQKRWLDVAEAAAYLGVSRGTLYNRTSKAAGIKVPVVKDGGRIMFDIEDLDRYMEERKRYPEGDAGREYKPRVRKREGGIFGAEKRA